MRLNQRVRQRRRRLARRLARHRGGGGGWRRGGAVGLPVPRRLVHRSGGHARRAHAQPDDYLQRKAQRRANVICAGLFIVVMSAIGTAFTLTERSVKDVERHHAAVDQEYTEAARRIEQVRKMQDKQRQMAQQAELTASLLEKVPRTFVLAEITNGLPSGVSLLDFVLQATRRNAPPPMVATKTMFEQKKQEIEREKLEKKLAAEQLQPRLYDVMMKVTGVADNDVQVSQFITKLNHSPLFKDVNLLISDEFERDGQKLRKFQIELTLVPDADVSNVKLATRTEAREIDDPAAGAGKGKSRQEKAPAAGGGGTKQRSAGGESTLTSSEGN
jgi:Tfp pilus assembly protein PilN